MPETAVSRALTTIFACTDPKKLRQIAHNAREKGELGVVRAAELRLYAILPSEAPGTFEHDVWQSIHALEGALALERGKTARLTRTRQKITRVGEHQTISDLVLAAKPSEGFFMLTERGMTELTFEAVALRHPERFDADVLEAARLRLLTIGAVKTP